MWSIRFPRHPVKEREDSNELDNLLLGLLEGPPVENAGGGSTSMDSVCHEKSKETGTLHSPSNLPQLGTT